MATTLNLSLTDDLRSFIDENCGDGTLYATPSEFVRDLLRHKKSQYEAELLRNSLIEGFQDVIEGRVHKFSGSLSEMSKKLK